MFKTKYTKEDLHYIYNYAKSEAINYAQNKKYDLAFKRIHFASVWASLTRISYSDSELEILLQQISEELFSPITVKPKGVNRFVILDSLGIDNMGLVQQYARALMQLDYEFLYINVRLCGELTETLREIREYKKATVCLINQELDVVAQSKEVVRLIKEYAPDKLLLHIVQADIASLLALHSMTGVTKYLINFIDHTFWLGSTFLDYCLEFRPFGMTTSIEKRGLKPEQLLYSPFYSIHSKFAEFQGLPSLPEGAVVLLTGGSFYKMFDGKDTFFHIVDSILDLSPVAYLFIAGKGNTERMNTKVAAMRNASRVSLIGHRADIDAVYEHCDIYIDTYPLSGGLMRSYAVHHSKPVLSFSDVLSEECSFDHLNDGVESFNNMQSLLEYARRIIHDKQYRISEGKRLNTAIVTPQLFAGNFGYIVNNHSNSINWSNVEIMYDKWEQLYLEMQNSGSQQITKRLLSVYRLSAFLRFPMLSLIILPALFNMIKEKALSTKKM